MKCGVEGRRRGRDTLVALLYSTRMKLAQLPSADGVPKVQLNDSCTGATHAPVYFHPRSPRRLASRALPPSPPAGATADGSRLAQSQGLTHEAIARLADV